MVLAENRLCDWRPGCTEVGRRPVSVKFGTITYLCHEHHEQVCELLRFDAVPDRWQPTLKEQELGF